MWVAIRRMLPLKGAMAAAAILVGCGGGGGGGTDEAVLTSADATVEAQGVVTKTGSTVASTQVVGTAVIPAFATSQKPSSRSEAARFLTQATFGPTSSDVDRLMAIGYEQWIKEQLGMPVATVSHLKFWEQANATYSPATGQFTSGGWPTESFWRQALSGPDQLRQRVAFALSEIFVISNKDACGDQLGAKGVAAYMDMLGQKAFGGYRGLLQSVALNPVMGCFLSHVANQREDAVSGREPDQNFAREVMQLFSIGLHELNKNGTPKLDANGIPIETYGPTDIAGLAKVFTGWSWYCGDFSDRCFLLGIGQNGYSAERWNIDMQPFPKFHSVSEKKFLGVTIAAQAAADPTASLRIALDRLSAHPNVAPFIGKQLIQRLVTSNPSPEYIARVAGAFDRSGGNLGAMVYAILMDPEARDTGSALSSPTFGKPKEPVIKLANFLRAFGATSTTGSFLLGYLEDPSFALGQSPMRSPTVFNFFRPGYVMPGSQSAAAGLLTPEFQILDETSIAGFANYMRTGIYFGFGKRGYANNAAAPDVLTAYQRNSADPLYALADNPAALVEEINVRLFYGSMSAGLRQDMVTALTGVDLRSKTSPTLDQITQTRIRRVWSAVFLAVVAPEYQIQR